MPFPFSFWRTKSATFDPATLSLTGWWRASFSGSPWVAVASAGSSGSNGSLTEATNPPATGAAVNGLTPADFDGANDRLANSNTLLTFIDANRYWGAALFKVDSFTTNSGNVYDNAPIHGDSGGFWGLVVKGSGASGTVHAWHWEGATPKDTSVSISTGTWYLAVFWYDGANINLIVNGTTATPVAATNVGGLVAQTYQTGKNYSTAFHDGPILELALSDAAYGSTEAGQFRTYAQARYGLSL